MDDLEIKSKAKCLFCQPRITRSITRGMKDVENRRCPLGGHLIVETGTGRLDYSFPSAGMQHGFGNGNSYRVARAGLSFTIAQVLGGECEGARLGELDYERRLIH